MVEGSGTCSACAAKKAADGEKKPDEKKPEDKKPVDPTLIEK